MYDVEVYTRKTCVRHPIRIKNPTLGEEEILPTWRSYADSDYRRYGGLIGRHLIPRLGANTGHQMAAITRNPDNASDSRFQSDITERAGEREHQ